MRHLCLFRRQSEGLSLFFESAFVTLPLCEVTSLTGASSQVFKVLNVSWIFVGS